MGKIKDLTGQKFGHLTVIKDTGQRKNRQVVWECECDCESHPHINVLGGSLRSSHTTSCGCSRKGKNVIDLVGQQFGQLTVIERQGTDSNRHALWLCECTCGNTRIAPGSKLRSGEITRCEKCSIIKMSNKGHPYYGHGEYKDSKWYKSIINQKFGKLTPIKPTDKRDNAGRVIWECKCDCGNPNPIYVAASFLKTGNTLSCGCLKGHSIGEEKIANILNKENIEYQREYIFNDLISPRQTPLRFDFAIFKNNELQLLIEFDGIQHFKSIEYFGGEERFKYQLECDNLKNKYCQVNNIKLKRIKYTEEEQIEEILLNILKDIE